MINVAFNRNFPFNLKFSNEFHLRNILSNRISRHRKTLLNLIKRAFGKKHAAF